jgi:hypothetical protein
MDGRLRERSERASAAARRSEELEHLLSRLRAGDGFTKEDVHHARRQARLASDRAARARRDAGELRAVAALADATAAQLW